jgi:hypothetical protein
VRSGIVPELQMKAETRNCDEKCEYERSVDPNVCVPQNKMRKEHQYGEDVFYKKKL